MTWRDECSNLSVERAPDSVHDVRRVSSAWRIYVGMWRHCMSEGGAVNSGIRDRPTCVYSNWCLACINNRHSSRFTGCSNYTQITVISPGTSGTKWRGVSVESKNAQGPNGVGNDVVLEAPRGQFLMALALYPRHTGGAVPLRCYCSACTA